MCLESQSCRRYVRDRGRELEAGRTSPRQRNLLVEKGEGSRAAMNEACTQASKQAGKQSVDPSAQPARRVGQSVGLSPGENDALVIMGEAG